jgi:6-phosphofructokinase 1
MQRIGIMVNGGDAPGINATIEASARLLAAHGVELWGIRGGLTGLFAGNIERLTPSELLGSSNRGGALLTTSRDRVLADVDARQRLQKVWADACLEGLILLGGDGTIRRVASQLVAWGYPLFAIPCTIDRDVPGTEQTLGFDSACNRALPLVDAIRDTAAALSGRIFVVETLGGNTGHLALAIADAAQVDAVCVPEVTIDLQKAAKQLTSSVEQQGYAICVVSEGIGEVSSFCTELATSAGHRVRLTTLGHAQRGGPPSFFDRWLGRAWGEFAASELLAGRNGFMASWQANQICSVPIEEVCQAQAKAFDYASYQRVNGEW